MIFVYLLVLVCSYWGLIHYLTMDITPIVVVLLALTSAISFLKFTPFKKYTKEVIWAVILNWSLVIVMGLSINFNYDTFEKGITQYILFPLVFISFCSIVQKVKFDKLFRFIIFINIPNLLGSFLEHSTGNYLLPTSHMQYIDGGVIRTAAFVGDMISLPLILGYCTIISVYLAISKRKIVYLVVAILYAASTFVSQSRGPFMATIIGVIIMFILMSNKKSTNAMFGKKTIFAIVIVALLLWLAYYIIVESTILDHTFLEDFAERIRTIFVWDNSNGDASNATRVEIWLNMYYLFLQNMWTGIGIGTTGSDRLVTIGATESAVFKRLVEIGIIGTASSVAMYIIMIRRALINIKNATSIKDKEEFIVLFSIVFVVFIEGFVLQIDEYFPATAFMWIAMSRLCVKPQKRILRK